MADANEENQDLRHVSVSFDEEFLEFLEELEQCPDTKDTIASLEIIDDDLRLSSIYSDDIVKALHMLSGAPMLSHLSFHSINDAVRAAAEMASHSSKLSESEGAQEDDSSKFEHGFDDVLHYGLMQTELPALTSFTFSHTPFTASILSAWFDKVGGQLKRLDSILNGYFDQSMLLSASRSLVKLETLNLDTFLVKNSVEFFKALSSFPSLREFFMDAGHFGFKGTTKDMPHFIKFIEVKGSSLTNLQLMRAGYLGDEAINAIARNCSKIESLVLDSIQPLTVEGILDIVRSCLKLTYLGVGGGFSTEQSASMQETIREINPNLKCRFK